MTNATDDYDHHSREMTQTDLALTSACKAFIQILLASGIAQPKTFDVYLGPMIETYHQQGDLKAAELLRMLLECANDPKRIAAIENRRLLQQLRPAGTA
jgi:hypothetical protein